MAKLLVRLPEPWPRKRAHAAVRKALQASDNPEKIEPETRRWLTYCQSEASRSVKATGFFIASKIENREPCPVRTAEEEGQRICLRCGHVQAEHGKYGCFMPDCVCRDFEPDDADWEPERE